MKTGNMDTSLLEALFLNSGGGWQGVGSWENRGWEVGEERAESGTSKKAGIGREMESTNFCYSLTH